MESYQPISPPTTNGDVSTVCEDVVAKQPAASGESAGELIGYVDVLVHSARDIQNICIYHKQDVYAKLSLPGSAAAATRVVNGGGRNPVFDETLRLGVHAGDVDAAVRCEVWMLSRVQNYLQDQLLGFALVPLPDVIAAEGGTLAREFALSSTDLFHSPSGFVQLSLSYIGAVPDVVPISPKPALAEAQELENGSATVAKEYEKIEFPDLNLVEENQFMVSEYFGLPCAAVEPQSSESLLTSEDGHSAENHDAGMPVADSFSTENSADSVGAFRSDTPRSSASTTDSSPVPSATPQSNPEPSANATASSEQKEKTSEVATQKTSEVANVEANSSSATAETEVIKPVVTVDIEQEVKVDRKEIMDMYMKSMQQFTESLAKMKLPMDVENGANGKDKSDTAGDGDSSSAKKATTPGSQDKCARVFYGSRAFF